MEELKTILKKHCLNLQNIDKLYDELNNYYIKNINTKEGQKAGFLKSAVFEIKNFLIENEK